MSNVRSVGEDVAATLEVVLGGRYSLMRRIAVGGMGEIWAAHDMVLRREVAVKILRDELVDSNEFLERFRHEARHTAALTHPGITSVFDYGEEDVGRVRKAFLIMELVDGKPLSEVMANAGRLDTETTLSILRQSAEALHAAHRNGVVHRDVKPGNLIVKSDGSIKLTDFGIARALSAVALTEVGQVIGTAKYMSPEQAQGREATPASDVYSLAVIGHEMLTGRAPFTGANPAALAMAHVNQLPPPLLPTAPEGLRSLLERSLAKDPADRPHDALEFAREVGEVQRTLRSSLAGTTVMDIVPVEETAVMTVAGEPRRNWVPVLFGMLVAVVIAVAALAGTGSGIDRPPDGIVVATSLPTGSVDSTTPVPTTVAPQTGAPAPAPVPNGDGSGNGQSNGKGKGKGGAKD